MGRLRRENGASAAIRPYQGFSIGAAAPPLFPQGRDGSPSGPKTQARSVVSGKKISPPRPILPIIFSCKQAANRSPTILRSGSIFTVPYFSLPAVPSNASRGLLPARKSQLDFWNRSAIGFKPAFGGSMPPPSCLTMFTWFLGFHRRRMWSNASGIGNDGRRACWVSSGRGIFSSTDFAMTKVSKRKFSMSSKIPFGPGLWKIGGTGALRSCLKGSEDRGGFAAKMGRLGDPSLPFVFDRRCRAAVVPLGRDGSPSCPKLQARSAV